MLKSNTEAINAVSASSPADLLSAICDMRSYVGPSKTLGSLAQGKDGCTLLAALPNEDSDALQYAIIESNAEGVIAGIAAVKKAFGLADTVIALRDEKYAAPLNAAAGKCGLSLNIEITDIVDTRKYSSALMLSFEELAAVADIVTGTISGKLIRIDGGDITEVPFSADLPSFSENIKAYMCGHILYPCTKETLSAEKWYGSGQIKTITDDSCLIQAALAEIRSQKSRSCGKCTFCREGLYQLEAILRDITLGKSKPQDPSLLEELCETMTGLNNCSLGNTAALPVMSLMDNFRDELYEHLEDRICRSGECTAFTEFVIDPSKCKACHECAKVCEAGCIDTKNGYTSMIDTFDCTKCGKCETACPGHAILRITGLKKAPEQKMLRIKGAKTDEVSAKETKAPAARRLRRPKVQIMPFSTADNDLKDDKENRTAPDTERREIMERLEADAIVVAGGPAGLAAAVTLGEHGLKSILFEKSNTTGGAANMGMGILGIDTHIQKKNFNNITVGEALKKHMEYTHYQVDEDLVQTYFHKSASTVEWLESLGVEFAGAYRYFKESEATWHIVKPDNGIIGPRAAGKMARILTEKAVEYGCEIRLETPATDLIVEDGRVCGVIAKDKAGNYIEARAKAVVVATGGFGNNKKMNYEKFGLTLNEDYFPFQIPGLDGDGLNMMWKAGAQEFGTNIETIYQLPDNANWSVLDGVLRQPNLLINQFGERFMNEGDMGNTTFTGNAIRLQPGHYAYCIMDDGILRHYKKYGPDMISLVHSPEMIKEFDEQAEKAAKAGYKAYFEASSVSELAEKLGIDEEVLQNTIDEYNEMCECGVDSKFHKDQRFLHPLTGKGKYYAGKYYLGAYGTIGGVRINRYCEVLDKNCLPIEGLYSAGTDANTIYGDSYNFTLPGNSMGFAVNTGRMAAESIADYIESLG